LSSAIPATAGRARREARFRFAPWGALGIVLFALGLWALAADLEAWNTVWYLPAWYGYLLVVDAVIYARRGSSFLSDRRGELAAMMLWSLPFWLVFRRTTSASTTGTTCSACGRCGARAS